ncbi:protein [Scardovia inopinata]|uniref:Uncharacterized protein n=2 Tax=Scardovia inopinata TaxID=78259 RepID=W5IHJ0_SCAIO|nr:hypothetical protein HMPREF9020_01364 [Scardovia inopinata F0304]SUV51156.1 protein [Scardovia inopinata]
MQKIYRRRRIIALLILLAVIAALVAGIVGISHALSHRAPAPSSSASVTSSASPSASGSSSASAPPSTSSQENSSRSEKSKLSGIPDCTSSYLSLSLNSNTSTVQAGSSIIFSMTMSHQGKKDCLIDASASSRVLVITSGNATVWRSDVCESESRMLLMTGKDKDTQSLSWPTTASQSVCKASKDLKTVNPGTYKAYIFIKSDPAIKSNELTLTVTEPPSPSPSPSTSSSPGSSSSQSSSPSPSHSSQSSSAPGSTGR